MDLDSGGLDGGIVRTAEVLREAGYAQAEIDRMLADGSARGRANEANGPALGGVVASAEATRRRRP